MRAATLLPLMLWLLASAHAQAPLRVGTLEDPAIAEPINKVLREAYERAGLQVQFEPLPLRRAL